MVLVDTSIWIAHLRYGNRQLELSLMDTQVVCHPFIIGELACGNLRNRTEFLSLLQTLPMVPVVSQDELLFFIMQHELMGKGIGFVDINLLASAQQSEISLWTSDGRLNIAAEELGLAHS